MKNLKVNAAHGLSMMRGMAEADRNDCLKGQVSQGFRGETHNDREGIRHTSEASGRAAHKIARGDG